MILEWLIRGTIRPRSGFVAPRCYSWWRRHYATVPAADVAVISEVDRDGNAVFHMNLSERGEPADSYRVYHADEESVTIPLNLP